MRSYIYRCSFCNFEQVVHMKSKKKAPMTIDGFCAKDKFHSRTKYRFVSEKLGR